MIWMQTPWKSASVANENQSVPVIKTRIHSKGQTPQWLWLTDKCKPLKAWGQIVREELPIIPCHSLGVVLTSPNQEDGCKDAHHLYWTAGCSKGWKQGGAKIQGQLNFRVFPNVTKRNSCFYSNARARLMPPPAVTKAGTQSLFQTVTRLPKVRVLLL